MSQKDKNLVQLTAVTDYGQQLELITDSDPPNLSPLRHMFFV